MRVAEHGTISGYQRHLRDGPPPCAPCRAANAAYAREHRRAAPRHREYDRRYNGAYAAAAREVARRHPEEFAHALAEERRKRGLE